MGLKAILEGEQPDPNQDGWVSHKIIVIGGL